MTISTASAITRDHTQHPYHLTRLDTLQRAILAIQAIEDDLQSAGFEHGAGRAARGMLQMARRALADTLAGELAKCRID